jgi:hypothetical protein
MRPVCRAAIGGLFAIWLAPLAPDAARCGDNCRCAETRDAEPAACAAPAVEAAPKA